MPHLSPSIVQSFFESIKPSHPKHSSPHLLHQPPNQHGSAGPSLTNTNNLRSLQRRDPSTFLIQLIQRIYPHPISNTQRQSLPHPHLHHKSRHYLHSQCRKYISTGRRWSCKFTHDPTLLSPALSTRSLYQTERCQLTTPFLHRTAPSTPPPAHPFSANVAR